MGKEPTNNIYYCSYSFPQLISAFKCFGLGLKQTNITKPAKTSILCLKLHRKFARKLLAVAYCILAKVIKITVK